MLNMSFERMEGFGNGDGNDATKWVVIVLIIFGILGLIHHYQETQGSTIRPASHCTPSRGALQKEALKKERDEQRKQREPVQPEITIDSVRV